VVPLVVVPLVVVPLVVVPLVVAVCAPEPVPPEVTPPVTAFPVVVDEPPAAVASELGVASSGSPPESGELHEAKTPSIEKVVSR
jgi:hypothetical protein